MNEKRFKIVHLRNLDMCDIQDTLQETPTFYNDLGCYGAVKPLCDLLNELNKENVQLKQDVERINDARLSYKQDWKYAVTRCEILEDENEQLKKENKTLADGLTAYFESKIKRG